MIVVAGQCLSWPNCAVAVVAGASVSVASDDLSVSASATSREIVD
jgi:hypothetical protein